MNNDISEDTDRNSGDSGEDSSFVTKVRSRVSGLFNHSISRLFGTTSERRKNEDDNYESQPPTKRPKTSQDFYSFNNDHSNHINNSFNFLPTTSTATSTISTSFTQPGPSGMRTLSQNFYKLSNTDNNLLNGEKDSDSGESTSGYSSMARINQEISRKQNQHVEHNSISKSNMSNNKKEAAQNGPKKLFNISTPEIPNRSIFGAESLSPQCKNTSLSSRRPSFNSSNFSSPNFVDRTLTTSRIVNSPFYNGPTIYGGASAYDIQRQESLRRQQLKNSFRIQPVNKNSSNPCTSLSKTARRILDTLEQYSSTLSDVKKIPPPTKVEKKEGLFTKYVGANPYTLRKQCGSNKELLVPSMPELLRMKEKIKIQEGTDKIRKLATMPINEKNDFSYETSEKVQQKHTNKIKTKISSVRTKTAAPSTSVEIIQDIKLTPVPLTLPENKLPKFDMVIPPPSSCHIDNNKKETVIENFRNYENEYKFSRPLVISSGNFKSIVAINNFKFSEPVSKKQCSKKIDNSKIDDPLMVKFKPPENTWECETCLIRNKNESSKCLACETPRKITKSNSTDPIKTKKLDEWECNSCWVRNKKTDDKCIACGTFKIQIKNLDAFKKSKNEWECQTCLIRNKNDTDKCIACESLKPNCSKTDSDSTWKCETCLIRNKNDSKECAACKTPKEKIFVVKSNEKWECPTCMVRNDNSANQCPCCETPKPGGSITLINKNTVNMFNFGVNKTQFNFGIKPENETIDLTNETDSNTFKFGVANEVKSNSSDTSFKFGIEPSSSTNSQIVEKSKETTTPSKDETLKLNLTPSVSSSKETTQTNLTTTPCIKLGEKTSMSETKECTKTTLSGFQFKPTNVEKSESTKTAPMFKFGENETVKTDNSTNNLFTFGKKNEESKAPIFSFGKPSSNSDNFKFGDGNTNNEDGKLFSFALIKPTTTTMTTTTPKNTTTNDVSLKNGGFNFGNAVTVGNNNNNQAAVFSFGAKSQSSSGGFNFTTPVSSSAADVFNFSTSAPAFDANIKPSFNFTGGSIPSFSASPAESMGGMPTRKIKKAVRRVAPR